MKSTLFHLIKLSILSAFCFFLVTTNVFATDKKLDFDGDGITDYTVVRQQSTGSVWYIFYSNTNTYSGINFGASSNSDVPVPEDYDGDGKTDIAVYRINDTYCTNIKNTFYILQSNNNSIVAYCMGGTQIGGNPVVQDYDGDGKADPTISRPIGNYAPNGIEILSLSSQNTTTQTITPATGYPLQEYAVAGGDFDGDGKDDFAYGWYTGVRKLTVKQSSNNTDVTLNMSGNFVLADFSGDGKTDIADITEYQGSILWTIHNSNNTTTSTYFGIWNPNVDRATFGYYDADNKADVAVVRYGGIASDPKYFYYEGTLSGVGGTQWGINSDEAFLPQY